LSIFVFLFLYNRTFVFSDYIFSLLQTSTSNEKINPDSYWCMRCKNMLLVQILKSVMSRKDSSLKLNGDFFYAKKTHIISKTIIKLNGDFFY